MNKSAISHLLLGLIGAAFILWGVLLACLGLFGQSTSAALTTVRREPGEWNDGKPGRYTYSIGYRFILPDGREMQGTAKKIDDGVYLKGDGSGRLQIRYLTLLPIISSPESQAGNPITPLIFIFTGSFLLLVAKPRKKQTRAAGQVGSR